MRILIDECLPVALRRIFKGEDARTVEHMGWKGLTNGRLLAAAETEGFDVLVTADQGIPWQQDMAGRKLALVLVPTLRLKELLALADDLRLGVAAVRPGEVLAIPGRD